MTDNYQKYEIECEKIRKQNAKLLGEFAFWLQKSNLKDETIEQHVNNIDFYINEYLLYEDATEAKEGVFRTGMFLGYWFIKKAMWANPSQIKANAASLKKFYTFMLEKRLINKEELDDLKKTIKAGMPEWVATMRRYDDPSITDMEDVWGI